MLISRTPVRVSFCGGGTDLAAFYENHSEGGAVTSMALRKYLYVTVNPRFDDEVRVSYSKTEIVTDFEQLKHELVREAMRLTGVTRGVEITTIADIPSRGTGLGSSSTLTVGLLNALHRFAGREVSQVELAEQACQIEIEVLKQPIGKQDQFAAALGGINTILFLPDGSVEAEPLEISEADISALAEQFTLVYTGATRRASNILAKQTEITSERMTELGLMREQALEVRTVIESGDFQAVGNLLGEAWQIKRGLVQGISAAPLDELYESLISAGATGGKLLGAGGGGFFLIHSPNGVREKLASKLPILHRQIPLQLDLDGTMIIVDDGARQE
jgi:D-glycero-alpha-D-manno-heptose-7-phosphate kinase